jgi:photosystem II stability/assembly factor-like uncharacterized protein
MKPTGFRMIHRLPVAVAAGLGLTLAAAGCDGRTPQPEPAATADVVPPGPTPVAHPSAPVATAVTPTAQSSGAAERRPVLAGGPVPTGFVAWSVTFVSDRQAYVLGDAPCHRPPCTSVVRTLDGGRSWRGVPAPRAPLPARAPTGTAQSPETVHQIRFATEQDGYAYGGGLWATHDGARTWRRVSGLDTVLDLEIDGRTAYAVVGHCAGLGRCRSGLLASPVSADRFRPVTGLEPRPAGGLDGAVSTAAGLTVFSFDHARYIHRRTGGWTRMTEPCQPLGGAVVAPASGATLTAYCAEGAAGSVHLTIRQSTDLGQHWTTVPGAALRLPNGLTAVTAGSATTLAASAAVPDLGGGLAVSRDHGRTWSAVPTPANSIGWRYVGARSATALAALVDPPAPTLWTSDTAGRTWTVHPIR